MLWWIIHIFDDVVHTNKGDKMSFIISILFYFLFFAFSYFLHLETFSVIRFLLFLLLLFMYYMFLRKKEKNVWIHNAILSILFVILLYGVKDLEKNIYFFTVYFICLQSFAYTAIYQDNL